MKILIDEEVVGELTEDGEIETEDLWLKDLVASIDIKALTTQQTIKSEKYGLYGVMRKATSKKALVSAWVNILLNMGYGVRNA